jgi:hypothetical protein
MQLTKNAKFVALAAALLAPAGALLGLSQAEATTTPTTAADVAAAATTTTTTSPVTTVQPYGVNFTLHTFVDPSFCIESTASAAGSPLSVSTCAARDNQHWTTAQSTDGSFVLISGEGQCVTVDKQSAFGMDVGPCTFNGDEHFLYSATGQFENRAAKQCLQFATAAQGATVFFTKCNANTSQQIIQIGH